MADLAQSAVTIVRAWTEGGLSSKERACRQVKLELTTQGGATNKIPATALQLTKIEESSTAVTSDDAAVIITTPSYDGSFLILANLAQTTDANRDDPADFNGITIQCVVKGYL